MRKLFTLILLPSLFLSTTVSATEHISATVSVTNNYLWRGLEQTEGKPAISASIDFTPESGFYIGTWVSNASWSKDMTYELDLYSGYNGEINNIGYDIGVIYYAYPDSITNSDFSEAYINISTGIFTFGYATLINGNNADFGDDAYLSASAIIGLTPNLAFNFNIGANTGDFYSEDKFTHYGVALSTSQFSFGLSKTNLDDRDIKFHITYSINIDLYNF